MIRFNEVGTVVYKAAWLSTGRKVKIIRDDILYANQSLPGYLAYAKNENGFYDIPLHQRKLRSLSEAKKVAREYIRAHY